ncbi:uncharacterized protein LOC112346529 [Selaginella moellendorffii]|uniref:uncharacterized protein LOC112346529 n=1 Tax=Selaginella moellendorffii TaxID=88036 RepID=UPI000D1CB7CE|nr:uncharacterized protein LOC112346529 [Selaginella moellendorffii]|eukprot:XP_024531451.1 uncharacterized protein LOC112346529 [Selaginella moellendorffii]
MTPSAKSSHRVVAIILLLLFPLMTRCVGGGPIQSRKLVSNPEREAPSGPDDPEQYRMKHRTSGCGGRDFQTAPSSNDPPAVVAKPDRDVPNGPEDPYSSHVKEMSSCWKPHAR